jgi:hypothetical protein
MRDSLNGRRDTHVSLLALSSPAWFMAGLSCFRLLLRYSSETSMEAMVQGFSSVEIARARTAMMQPYSES